MDWLSKLPSLSDTALAALYDNARRISSGDAAPPAPAPEKRKAGNTATTLKPDARLIATAGELLPAIEAELAARRVRHREALKSRPKVVKPPRKIVDDY